MASGEPEQLRSISRLLQRTGPRFVFVSHELDATTDLLPRLEVDVQTEAWKVFDQDGPHGRTGAAGRSSSQDYHGDGGLRMDDA